MPALSLFHSSVLSVTECKNIHLAVFKWTERAHLNIRNQTHDLGVVLAFLNSYSYWKRKDLSWRGVQVLVRWEAANEKMPLKTMNVMKRENRGREEWFRLLSVWCENNSAISTPHGFICCTHSHLNISTPLYSLLLCLLKVLRAACVFC